MALLWHFKRVFATDGVIDLFPINLYPPDDSMGFGECYDFIISPHGKRREAGQVSLRLGESAGVYYFGHIGYHVDPPYRGQHFAERACRLLMPLIETVGKTSVVITCDPDNAPSRRTIERLGCEYECTVPVPPDLQRRWELSPMKCRYVWRMPGTTRGL